VERSSASTVSANVQLSDPSPTTAGTVTVTLITSQDVINVPAGFILTESDASTKSIMLSGAVPGSVFTGTLVVDTSVADGQGTFSLPANSLVTSTGVTGNSIVQGAQVLIDKTPPATPANLHFGT
jgi:hypothetical protein